MPITGVSISAKRRGPYQPQMYSVTAYSEKCPTYVGTGVRNDLDLNLIHALHAASNQLRPEMWLRIFESILSYNGSNTDNSQLNIFNEVVIMTSAFERLLNKKGNAFQLKNALTKLFQSHPGQSLPRLKRQIPQRARLITFRDQIRLWMTEHDFAFFNMKNVFDDPYDSHRNCKSLRSLWMTDFYKIRNRFAHGHHALAHDSLWSPDEHMLLASHLFPLALKIILEKNNCYVLSNLDRRAIWSFDFLLCRKNLFKSRGTVGAIVFDWERALRLALRTPRPIGYNI